MAFRMEQGKSKVEEVKKNIETKKNELSDLEQNKGQLEEAGSDIESADIDENVKQTVRALIEQAKEANAEKGRELSGEMEEDAQELAEMNQEAQTSVESTKEQKSSLERKRTALDKYGLGGYIDQAVSALDDNRSQLEELQESMNETDRQLQDVMEKLDSL